MTETLTGLKKTVLFFTFACLLLMGGSSMYYRGQTDSKKTATAMPSSAMESEGQIMALMQQLQENPQDIDLLTRLGQVFMSMGAWERSISFWQRVLALPGQEQNLMALTQLGNCFFELKKYELSAESFERIVRVHQHSAPSFFNLGLLYKYHLKQPIKAKTAFSRVIELNPQQQGLVENAKKELASLP